MMTTKASPRSLRGLNWLNFFLADVQSGIGPFLAVYLASRHWNPEQVGFVLTLGGLVGIAAQTPGGILVDRSTNKKMLIAAGVVLTSLASLLVAFRPSFTPVLFSQAVLGLCGGFMGPAMAAIALGLVGQIQFPRRMGQIQSFNAAGNVVAALSMGLIGYCISNRAIFVSVVFAAVPAFVSLISIRGEEINNEAARGLPQGARAKASSFRVLLKDSRLLIFAACAVLFHFANAAMLPILGEMLSRGRPRESSLLMSACIITTQVVVTIASPFAGRGAARWGRKPVFLIAFAVLPLRGLLYTLTSDPVLLVAIQLLDGIGACIFGIVSLAVLADLTNGTGRFNFAQGALATAVRIGASLSNTFAGMLIHRWSYNAAFLFLAGIAALAFLTFLFAMPETKPRDSKVLLVPAVS